MPGNDATAGPEKQRSRQRSVVFAEAILILSVVLHHFLRADLPEGTEEQVDWQLSEYRQSLRVPATP